MAGIRRCDGEARAELERLARALTDEHLAVDVGGGWTVATVFAHLAFRDRLLDAHWRAALAAGAVPGAESSLTSHLVNDALDELVGAVPGRVAVGAALSAAASIDALLGDLPEETLETTLERGLPWLAQRAGHRREPIDQGLAALDRSPGPWVAATPAGANTDAS